MEKKKLELAKIEISKAPSVNKVSDITDVVLADALTSYFTALSMGNNAKWLEYESLTEAVRVMSNEMICNPNGKKVQRFAKAKDLYKFLHLDDSKGDLAIKTIEYNSRRLWHNYYVTENGSIVYYYYVDANGNALVDEKGFYVDHDGHYISLDGVKTDEPILASDNDNKPIPIMVSYKDMGFNVSKVNELRKADDEGDVVNLISYIHDKDNECNGIRYLLEISDKSLKELIKAWYADGTPAHAPTPKKVNLDDINDKVNKKTDTKPTDTKPTDTKPTDTKPTDTKPTDTKPTDTKPTVDTAFKDVREITDYVKRYTKVVDRKELFAALMQSWGISAVRTDKKGNTVVTNR